MRRPLVALLCAAGATPVAGMAQQGAPPDSVSRFVVAYMEQHRIPGVSVAVLRGDSIVLRRGYGLANVELNVPASDSTIYQSGSVGKQFTAAAVVMLAEQGRLRLDDAITKWFPEGAGVWNGITVRQLLTHTSGIPDYTDSTFDYRRDYTEEDLVRYAAARPLNFPAGERWSYSNTGYVLLGALIHRVTGRFYGDVLRDWVFAPLGMRTTRVISEADIIPNRAAGYRLVNGEMKNQDWVAPSLNTTADGALYFTVKDLSQWAVALNHRRIPSSAGLDAAWTPVRLNDGGAYPYGFGWYLDEQRGHPRIGHGGSWQGFRTAIERYPEFDLTVIVLANLAEAEAGTIATSIAGLLERPLLPPHLLASALPGPEPPRGIADLLQAIGVGADSGRVTPGFQRFLSPSLRQDYARGVATVTRWTPLGCERVHERHISRLGATVERICYARADGSGGHRIVSVFYDQGWRAVWLTSYAF